MAPLPGIEPGSPAWQAGILSLRTTEYKDRVEPTTRFFIIAVQTRGSGISILLAVGTPSTASGNLYCQWELSPGSGNALCILFPTIYAIWSQCSSV
nr:hypothetical protein [Tanacetum cinerariifolium]